MEKLKGLQTFFLKKPGDRNIKIKLRRWRGVA